MGGLAAIAAQALAISIESLDGPLPADRVLAGFFRAHPKLGRRDRGLIAEAVFDVLRNRRRYAWLAQGGAGDTVRRLLLLSPAANALARSPEESAWLARLAGIDEASLPPAVRASLPDWLATALAVQYGAGRFEAITASLLRPAPLDLRVNLLKGSRDEALAVLAADGIDAGPSPLAATALRVRGKPALERSRAFVDGLVEVQDAGSQALCAFAGPRRGQTVVDLCAGAGGKTLAMAAAMRSRGQVFACDVSAARLARLRPRLVRSGASNVQPMRIESEVDPRLTRLRSRADLVLVDAPCSGTGTLRRNPDLKWRLAPDAIARLANQQRAILGAASRLVKPGGVLVYATCSLLEAENEAVAAWFDSDAGWQRRPAPAAFDAWCNERGELRLSPERDDSDGFFAAAWSRAAGK